MSSFAAEAAGTPIYDALAGARGGCWRAVVTMDALERADLTVSHVCALPEVWRLGASWECDCGKVWTYQ